MLRQLKFEIKCGATTCASKPGKFCKYVGTTRFGTTYICMLFKDIEYDYKSIILKEDRHGWLQRCPQCLEAEQKD